ncbi:hypothetical protein C8F01DRAFT_751051 [Mycena amicta]|nr:hypothetical protein C8F01DRAFT_751051 [Mycena amicta]
MKWNLSKAETRPAAELRFRQNSVSRPILASSLPEYLRNVLNTEAWDFPGKWDNMSKLAQKAVGVQVEAYRAYVEERMRDGPGQVDVADVENVEEFLNMPEELRARVSYPSLRRVEASDVGEPMAKRRKGADGEPMTKESHIDVDGWILKYEKHLSFTRHADVNWKRGLVTFADADVVFSGSTLSAHARTITRPTTLPGFCVLSERRDKTITIQPSLSASKARFAQMTGDVLKGLDWNNVFIAGGMALGALLSVKDDSSEEWKSSDIDLYIHGLSAPAATEKIQHIYDVFRSNLPSGAPSMVVRNSKTITFYSNYPTRRIQVVLKLVRTPRDVLLNFDLDICAMGWDGEELYMLPRCARALETGYSVFTMDLIQGHYLSERRASHEKRVFKYAYRGFGIRILPSYILSLEESQKNIKALSRRERVYTTLDIDKIASISRAWTKKVGGSSHVALENGDQVTSEVQTRSCLNGFALFMRHVALFEMEARGETTIKDDRWAETSYADSDYRLAYDDTPNIHWGPKFTLAKLTESIDDFNKQQVHDWIYESGGEIADVTVDESEWHSPVPDFMKPLSRITYGNSPADVLRPEKDLQLGILVPFNFAMFANRFVEDALANTEGGVPPVRILNPVSKEARTIAEDSDSASLCFFVWRLPAALLWQQVDRRIDEVFEALYAFYFTHDRLIRAGGSKSAQTRLVSLLSRRAIVTQVEDEFAAFARWVGRKPMYISWFSGYLDAYMGPDEDGNESNEGDWDGRKEFRWSDGSESDDEW